MIYVGWILVATEPGQILSHLAIFPIQIDRENSLVGQNSD